jgi:m7GpppX diphosphatase
MYFHYQPSFYHLHVHFTHIDGEWGGQQCHRAHPLDSVIGNLQLYPDYYQRASLTFAQPFDSELLLKLELYRTEQRKKLPN